MTVDIASWEEAVTQSKTSAAYIFYEKQLTELDSQKKVFERKKNTKMVNF